MKQSSEMLSGTEWSSDTRESTASSEGHPTTDWWKPLFLAGAMLVLTFIGFSQLETPAPAPSSVPLTEFSTGRAMTHLAVIASSSRAIGMPGHDTTRDYLVEQLTLMGLSPEVQTTTAVLRFEGADAFNAGQVTNVIARVPGASSTGAIAINAHYDGGSTGPAAGDNGAAVAATLEVIRALLEGPPLANDVIVVFSDGEENGDLGAAAFNQDHPWENDVRLAINFEAQGSGGPAILYATSDRNGWLTARYFDVAPRASGYSLLPEIVRNLPGMRLACDLEDYLLNGSAGLGFVFAANTPAYHSELDSLENIDQGSIQQEGENTLALVEHFGRADLTEIPLASNRVFFNILPGVVVHYSAGSALLLTIVATLLTVTILIVGVRRSVLTTGGIAQGLVTSMLGSLVVTALVALLWIGIRAANGDYRVLMIGTYQSGLFALALSLASIALMTGLYWLLRHRTSTDNFYGGALLAWIPLAGAVSLVVPGASYLVIWPLLFALLPLARTVVRPDRDRSSSIHLLLLVVALIPAFILTPGTYYQVTGLLNRLDYFANISGGIAMFGLWAIFIAPMVGLYLRQISLVSSLFGNSRTWSFPVVVVVTAAVLMLFGLLTSGFDASQPRPNHIAYELDGNSESARWVSVDERPDAWTSQFLTTDPQGADYELVPGTVIEALQSPAPSVSIPIPQTEIMQDDVENGVRTITFRIESPRGAATLDVRIEIEGVISRASIDDRSLELSDYDPAGTGTLPFGYAGVSEAGIEISLVVESEGAITLTMTETTFGLPAVPGLDVAPRPSDTMPASGLPLDATIVRLTVSL